MSLEHSLIAAMHEHLQRLPALISCRWKRQLRSNEILLEGTKELSLLGWSLVCTVSKFGRGVDPLELHLFQSLPAGVYEH